jgi:enoyl-CoA hydratase/carnithine racemase
MSETPHLISDATADGILIVTLNRPEKLNSLSNQTMELFEQALLEFRDNAELKVMLIKATGRYFSAGADVREGTGNVAPRSAREVRENHRVRNRGMHRIYDEMEHIEKPIVVAHHAMCVGGGLELSLSCDFRLAADSAGYAFPENLMGVLPASNGVSRLVRVCGPHWARWLIMGNKPVPAAMALNIGLVHQVFPDKTFQADVMKFCQHLARQNPEQMGAAKIAIEIAAEVGRDTGRHIERMANSALMLNPDYQTLIDRHLANVGNSRN